MPTVIPSGSPLAVKLYSSRRFKEGERVPHQYEAIRDSLMTRGKSPKTAKRIAAATYNKNRPKGAKPVTGKHRSLADAQRYPRNR